MKNAGSSFYVFVRLWPAFIRSGFPFADYNRLSDEELWPVLIKHSEKWLKYVGSKPDFVKRANGSIVTPERLMEIEPGQRQFYRTGVLAGRCTTGKSFCHPSATGYEILVTNATPLLKVDNEDDARKVVEAIQHEYSERFTKATWGIEKSELSHFFARFMPRFSYIPDWKFGDVNDRAKIELRMDNDPSLSTPESIVRFVRKISEVIQRDRENLEYGDSATTAPSPFSEECTAILEKLDGIEQRI